MNARRGLAILAPAVVLAACAGGSASDLTRATASLPSTPCGTYSGRGCAPLGARVDLRRPEFSHPTEITNPLFPIARLRSTLFLGHVDGKPFRTETTLLPGSRTVTWDGRRIKVLVSQYMAYLDGRIDEVALDRYAQADDGSVWYLGEDVFDYRDGTIAFTEGTWLAGREGPAAMIMPGHPRVGDAFRTENAPGIVFEEVTVETVDKRIAGPHGAIARALVGRELHADGTSERKIFAPGYGEFRTSGGGDLEALALSVPADALREPGPRELATLSIGATAVLESVRVEDWEAASATTRHMSAAWRSLRARGQPPLVESRATERLAALVRAVRTQRPRPAEQAAIDLGQSALDLELRYRPQTEIDAKRFELWTQQLRVDAAARDLGHVTGDIAALEWIRDRFAHTLAPAARRELDERLHDVRAATDAKNVAPAADHAARLAAWLRG